MVGSRPPGCTGCGKTPHGGRQLNLQETSPTDRYEVRQGGLPVGRFRSVVAAATFMAGKPGATVHTIDPATDAPPPA